MSYYNNQSNKNTPHTKGGLNRIYTTLYHIFYVAFIIFLIVSNLVFSDDKTDNTILELVIICCAITGTILYLIFPKISKKRR